MRKTLAHVRHQADPANGTNPGSPRRLWKAVSERDETMNGAFVYAVRSTGVYCVPSGPARRPGREQVIFFDGPETAERNGYRACRRCRPRERSQNSDLALIGRLCRIIEAGTMKPRQLVAVATRSGISR